MGKTKDFKAEVKDSAEVLDGVQPEVKAEVVEDLSAYNCAACKGQGLVENPEKPGDEGRMRCFQCSGTGKV